MANSYSEPYIDLRLIFTISANVLSGIGFVLNLLLVYLIFFKTPKKMSNYKIILIQNCFVDILFNIFNDIFKGQTDYKNGAFYLIANDMLKGLAYANFLSIEIIWTFTLFYCVTAIPVQFIYRYFIICHEKTLKIYEYITLLLIAIFGALSFALLNGYVFYHGYSVHEEKEILLKNDIFYYHGIPPFVVAEIQQWPLKILFAYGYLLVTVSYVITIWAFYKVWKKLKTDETKLSPHTKRMHTQMTKTMLLQANVPLIFVLIPIGCAITATFTLINIPGLGMIMNFICCWIPVANPFVTIISIKLYRKTIFSYFLKLSKLPLLSSSVSSNDSH